MFSRFAQQVLGNLLVRFGTRRLSTKPVDKIVEEMVEIDLKPRQT